MPPAAIVREPCIYIEPGQQLTGSGSTPNSGMALYKNYLEYERQTYWNSFSTSSIPAVLQHLHDEYKAGHLDKLQPIDCLNRYATGIQSTRSHVLLVASNENFPSAEENSFIDNSHVYWASPFEAADAEGSVQSSNSYNWICSGLDKHGLCSNDINDVRSNISAWRVGHYCKNWDAARSYDTCNGTIRTFPVQYCLSEKAEPHCRLQFDTTIAVVVTMLNAGKSSSHLDLVAIAFTTVHLRENLRG
jgi:hypothetical protein